ncbi:MAG TPA: adenylate/guanylate cyclase domain-containing protein [Pseudonocardia sp.]|jgi:class 3 adenylate cyclase
MRMWATGYERGGTRFVRAGLIWIHLLGCAFVLVSTTVLLPLYVPVSIGTTAFLAAFALAIFAVDGALTNRSTRPALARIEAWQRQPDPEKAEITWDAIADVPFAPLRSKPANALIAVLIVAWTIVAAWRLDLTRVSAAALIFGALLVWLYWLALRVFGTERLVRPPLADVSTRLTDHDGRPSRIKLTVMRRLLVVFPPITLIAVTAVAGMVGNQSPRTLAAGAASILATIFVAGWLTAQLAQSITEPIDELRAVADRVGRGDLQALVPVVSVDEIGSLSRSFNSMVAGLRDREHIRSTFGAYVDPDVAEHILARGPALTDGEEVEITALFLDVRGFTGYSETHTAREVVAMLNRLFELVVPIIARHGGHVDKFIGDGLLAVFGTPRPLLDHASQALAAATEIAAATEDRPDEPPIGIGLNSGPVVAGNLGGAGRYDFSVIGDVVNVAARVESATRHTGDTILISEYTHRLLPPNLAQTLTERPSVPLKGKTNPVALYTR